MREIDWKILKVLYEKKSMTQAAETLYMTQSALTKRIQAIESEWDVEVVKRSSKGVSFTEDGKYLVKRAHIMLDFLSEIEQYFSQKKKKREVVKIGIPNSFARLHMPKLFRSYTEKYDKIQIKTISNSSDVIIRQITDGTVDIGIICGDYPYLGEHVCLFEEELYIVAPKGIRIDNIEHLPLIESFLNPMVRLLTVQWWKNQFGSMPHWSYHVPYSDIVIEMVENGLGIGFLFGKDWKINEEKIQLLRVYDNDGETVKRKVWFMVSNYCYQSENVREFIEFVKEYYGVEHDGLPENES